MATGAYDSNGIWKYGEDDNISLFSTTLNKLADSTSTALTADRSRLSTLEAGSNAGLIPVIPTSVDKAGTGSSVAISSLGAVTFTTCTSLSLNGVFSAAYRNYRIVISDNLASVDSTSFVFGLRNGGVDRTASSYLYEGFYINATGVINGVYSGGATVSNLGYTSSNPGRGTSTLDIFGPFSSNMQTTYNSVNTSNFWYSQRGHLHAETIQNDGFTIFPGSGNISGIVQVYGYR